MISVEWDAGLRRAEVVDRWGHEVDLKGCGSVDEKRRVTSRRDFGVFDL